MNYTVRYYHPHGHLITEHETPRPAEYIEFMRERWAKVGGIGGVTILPTPA